MQDKKIYTVNASRLSRAYLEGFVQEGGMLCPAGPGSHIAILERFCSYEKGSRWGRFHCRSTLSSGSVLRIYALAMDGEADSIRALEQFFHDSAVPWAEKRACFLRQGMQSVGHEDILLYELAGEYLWIAVEIEGKAGDALHDMRLDSQGDNFIWTFPEIYQEERGFFHRYMSVFSTLYQELSDEAAHLGRYLDAGTAPVPVLLTIADWLGSPAQGDLIDTALLRRLVGRLYQLDRMKGTKTVIQELIGTVLGEEAFVMERSHMEGHIPSEIWDTCQRLYGAGMQDVAILVERSPDEKLQAQLTVLLKQFKPVRSRIRLVFCKECSQLDQYCYLDHNAVLSGSGPATADGGSRMDGAAML